MFLPVIFTQNFIGKASLIIAMYLTSQKEAFFVTGSKVT